MNHPTASDVSSAPGARSLSEAEQSATVKKVTARLIPLLFLCYVIAYVDRINVGFAKLHFGEVFSLNEKLFNKVFGLGAGMFFIGYFLFEVPSNLILQRIGARIWIARIMIVWGVVSMAFIFVKSIPMFYVMRFLLGVAEAGFFPGVILYFTYWYSARERARIVALFAVGGVVAGAVGSPVSGALLMLNGMGLAGWQWLFVLEAIPAVLVGFVVLWILPNGPQQARWLAIEERVWLTNRAHEEASETKSSRHHSLADAFSSGRVWLLCATYFLLNVGSYGYEMWLPTIVKGFSGQQDWVVGFITAVPYFVAGIAMFMYGLHSDTTGERRGHVAFAAIVAAAGFALAAFSKNPWLAMIGLIWAFAGLKSTLGPFWALATSFLSGTAAAGGIAFINSVGNLGGFVGPYLVGYIKGETGSDRVALILLGTALFGMGLCALAVKERK